ncbi:MAG: DnaD domain protein [Erysipelotrichaceae bacterium]|nr:DnaD domain protein [Erysipelotrichaceae bacterium]MDY5251751.1 DnaD domain protein [Erysipelotrichaceae bacterium]
MIDLKARDTYRIQVNDQLSPLYNASLLSLYQPIIGPYATLLYMTLINEGLRQRSLENHGRLCDILNMNIMDVYKARCKLEEFNLINSYIKTIDDKSTYIYIINYPLSPDSFFKNALFVKLLIRSIGSKQFELTASKLMNNKPSLEDFKNVSAKLKDDELESLKLDEVKFNKVHPKYSFINNDNIMFDYDRFFKKVSALVFPVELRNEENLKIIGETASLNGIGVDEMIILVGNSIDYLKKTFNADYLKKLAAKSSNGKLNAKDIYKSSPIAFLQAKQNGVAVGSSDRVILEHLAYKYSFNNEVINVLIEYVLNINQNRLIFNFVDKIASEWSRDNVKTKEDALSACQKEYKPKPSVKTTRIMPKYHQNNEDDSDREELLARLKKELHNG